MFDSVIPGEAMPYCGHGGWFTTVVMAVDRALSKSAAFRAAKQFPMVLKMFVCVPFGD
jgi:hypothetical protein